MTEFLGSWVSTLDEEEDTIALLLDTTPGQTVIDWQKRAHDRLLQSSRDCRLRTIRFVRESLLDIRDGVILPSAWLRLFHEARPLRRQNLLYGRLHAHSAWILRAVDQLVLPHLDRADEPLAPHDADVVTSAEWAAFFAENLVPRTGAASTKKTRSIVRQNLANLGILTIAPNTSRETRVRHSEPDPLAFAWLLWHELVTSRRTEAPESWASTASIAARIFATRRGYAERCVETTIRAGFCTRGYLAGSPLLHPVTGFGAKSADGDSKPQMFNMEVE